MEGFNQLLKAKTKNSLFKYHPKYEKVKLIFLPFADDLFILDGADVPSVRIIKESLEFFGSMSGLGLNVWTRAQCLDSEQAF